MPAQPDPHAELGVTPGATHTEIHQAFRRRLREHHPDIRPQKDKTTDTASDQALQRVLAAYETLRHQATTPPVETMTGGQLHTPDQQAPGVPSGNLGGPPFRATAVYWVRAVGTRSSHNPAHDRTRHGVPCPDGLIRWLLGGNDSRMR
jgi:hypothetical protein